MRTHILIYASSTVINVATLSNQRTHTIIYAYVPTSLTTTHKRQRMLLSINRECVFRVEQLAFEWVAS